MFGPTAVPVKVNSISNSENFSGDFSINELNVDAVRNLGNGIVWDDGNYRPPYSAPVISTFGSNSGRSNGSNGYNGSKGGSSNDQNEQRIVDLKDGSCFHCHEQGHQARDCTAKMSKIAAIHSMDPGQFSNVNGIVRRKQFTEACTFCGFNNHRPEFCFINPESASFKPDYAARFAARAEAKRLGSN